MLPTLVLVAALSPVLAQPPAPAPAPQEPPAAAAQTAAPVATPGAAEAHIEAGLAAFRKRRFGAAEEHFQKAVDADPSSAAATFYLAYTIYKIAEPKRPFHPEKQKAAELFAKAYQLDPQFEPVWAPHRKRKAS